MRRRDERVYVQTLRPLQCGKCDAQAVEARLRTVVPKRSPKLLPKHLKGPQWVAPRCAQHRGQP